MQKMQDTWIQSWSEGSLREEEQPHPGFLPGRNGQGILIGFVAHGLQEQGLTE